jgi:hypothetical protein
LFVVHLLLLWLLLLFRLPTYLTSSLCTYMRGLLLSYLTGSLCTYWSRMLPFHLTGFLRPLMLDPLRMTLSLLNLYGFHSPKLV